MKESVKLKWSKNIVYFDEKRNYPQNNQIQAQELALKIGIPNILQPGLVKEMIIAETLGHDLIHSKRDADACAPNNPSI